MWCRRSRPPSPSGRSGWRRWTAAPRRARHRTGRARRAAAPERGGDRGGGRGRARGGRQACAGSVPMSREPECARRPRAGRTSCRWPLAAGRWPLAAGRWPLAAGRWPLAAGRWPIIHPPGPGADVKRRAPVARSGRAPGTCREAPPPAGERPSAQRSIWWNDIGVLTRWWPGCDGQLRPLRSYQRITKMSVRLL